MNNNHQIGRIAAFCCNYTASVATDTLREAGLIPESLDVKKLPCTGRIEVRVLLDAFEQGAEAVFVAGCRADECHNLSGSRRAEKRVGYTKKLLKELGIDPDRIEMFFSTNLGASAAEAHSRAMRSGFTPASLST